MQVPFASMFERGHAGPLTELLARPDVTEAFRYIDASVGSFLDELIRICEIPAPPFMEQDRARHLDSRFRELGLDDVHIDQAGNVIGLYRGEREEPLLVLSAHLDTVFPVGTDVRVRRIGSRFCAPGIADDCSGLAALLGLIRALKAARIRTSGTIAFVATVGEEGEGDLRGVRHLFLDGPLGGRVSAFISFDGPGVEWITHQALGSKRYRITLTGPGGHSWGDFGVVNPVHALGRIIARLASYPAPSEPRTSYNIGRIEGGESVNVIPQHASMDVDLRSASSFELSKLEDFLIGSIHRSLHEENSLRAAAGKMLNFSITLIGNRPSGETPTESAIVRTVLEASRALGINPVLNRASTDSNVPISMGIQAVTIGVGGSSEDSHRLTEWFDPAGLELGYKRALLTALGMVGVGESRK